ncbi:hypothetical protein BU15DRAFT_78771 [Melanogaster broomeanus]|nr:hypothetical protein BU15DRAFT_78771 [Melanogaster broomeanus]
MAPSERSRSSTSSAASSPSKLDSFPSMTHSLAKLPTMSSVPNDMLHYNSGAQNRAMMEYALQKQRLQGGMHPHSALHAYEVRRSPSPALSDDAPITVRRQQNATQHSMIAFSSYCSTSALGASDVAEVHFVPYYICGS